MKSNCLLLLLVPFAFLGAHPLPARAQGWAEVSISSVLTRNDPWEDHFPGLQASYSGQTLRFEGVATVGGDPQGPFPATLYVQFDWVDPVLGVQYSPHWAFPVSYTPVITPIDVMWELDFCPSHVSLHFATDAPNGAVVAVGGSFTYWLQPKTVDIGLRAFDGTNVVALACSPDIPSPVAIHKNGTNYHVMTVATNSPEASKFRIQTSTGVKALMKMPEPAIPPAAIDSKRGGR